MKNVLTKLSVPTIDWYFRIVNSYCSGRQRQEILEREYELFYGSKIIPVLCFI